MHQSAWLCGKTFFSLLSVLWHQPVPLTDTKPSLTVLEIGSKSFNGENFTLRTALADTSLHETYQIKYIGMDMDAGLNVDVVINPKDKFYPVPNDSIDIIVSSSSFEHDPRFWMTFLKMLQVLKPGGFLQLNMPYAWAEHRYPVDCWRFYRDSGYALYEWGMDNGFAIHLLLTEKMPGFLSKDGTDMNIVIYKQQAVDKEDYLLELKKSFSVSYMTNFNALNSDLYEIAKVLKLSSAIIPGSGGVKIFFTADNNGTVGEALISENYEVSFN